jgi:DNA-binding transcriptional MerR regulator
MTRLPNQKCKKRYMITQLCREFGVTARTLRFYEAKGLLHPTREGVNRIFSFRDRARLQIILRGKRIGFSLDEIKDTLELYHVKDGDASQLQITFERGKQKLEILKLQQVELQEAVIDLERALEIVHGMLKERRHNEAS